MRKSVNWEAKAAYARNLTEEQLEGAINDCVATSLIWEKHPETDADGNADYYRDEASVYRAELATRLQTGDFSVRLVVWGISAEGAPMNAKADLPTFKTRRAADAFLKLVERALDCQDAEVQVRAQLWRGGIRIQGQAL